MFQFSALCQFVYMPVKCGGVTAECDAGKKNNLLLYLWNQLVTNLATAGHTWQQLVAPGNS